MVKMAGDLVMEFHKGISDFGMQNNTCKIPIKANSLTAYLAWGLCSLKPPNSEFGECDLGHYVKRSRLALAPGGVYMQVNVEPNNDARVGVSDYYLSLMQCHLNNCPLWRSSGTSNVEDVPVVCLFSRKRFDGGRQCHPTYPSFAPEAPTSRCIFPRILGGWIGHVTKHWSAQSALSIVIVVLHRECAG
jgi:hypothetical protein